VNHLKHRVIILSDNYRLLSAAAYSFAHMWDLLNDKHADRKRQTIKWPHKNSTLRKLWNTSQGEVICSNTYACTTVRYFFLTNALRRLRLNVKHNLHTHTLAGLHLAQRRRAIMWFTWTHIIFRFCQSYHSLRCQQLEQNTIENNYVSKQSGLPTTALGHHPRWTGHVHFIMETTTLSSHAGTQKLLTIQYRWPPFLTKQSTAMSLNDVTAVPKLCASCYMGRATSWCVQAAVSWQIWFRATTF